MPNLLISRASIELNPRTLHALSLFAVGVGGATMLAGIIVIVGGWILGSELWRSIAPGFASMKVNTSAALVLLGASMSLSGRSRLTRTIAQILAGSAMAIAVGVLIEYAFGLELGIDELFVRDPTALPGTYPGRPAFVTALVFALLGSALIIRFHQRAHALRTIAATVSALISWAVLIAYLCGPQALMAAPLFSAVALHTAILSLLLSLAVLAMPPAGWPVRIALMEGTGGVICRFLLPFAVFGPPLIGWILSRESFSALYPAVIRWGLFAAISSLGSVWLILLLAQRIMVLDDERDAAMRLSRNDPLTGLANRRSFDEFLTETYALARRHHQELAILVFDVDHFKAYNDNFGHPAGDDGLREVARVLTDCARHTDLVARLGGEEFGMILPQTGRAGARIIAERARTAIQSSQRCRRPITVSVGIGELSRETSSPAALIQAADAALYRAKRNGRNCTADSASEPQRSLA